LGRQTNRIESKQSASYDTSDKTTASYKSIAAHDSDAVINSVLGYHYSFSDRTFWLAIFWYVSIDSSRNILSFLNIKNKQIL